MAWKQWAQYRTVHESSSSERNVVKVMMRYVLQYKTQESALIQRAGSASLTLSIVRKPTALALACRSAFPSLKVTVGGCGPYRMRVPVQPFNLLFSNAIRRQ